MINPEDPQDEGVVWASCPACDFFGEIEILWSELAEGKSGTTCKCGHTWVLPVSILHELDEAAAEVAIERHQDRHQDRYQY
jgi:hypothetical protein